jgi:hypothetical protein
VKFTASLRHLFGRVDKKQIPPPPNRHITGATTGVFSPSTSVFWGARVRAMKNPARFFRPGFYTRISAYTFLHESCYMSRQFYRQKSQVAFRLAGCIWSAEKRARAWPSRAKTLVIQVEAQLRIRLEARREFRKGGKCLSPTPLAQCGWQPDAVCYGNGEGPGAVARGQEPPGPW